MLKKGIKMLYLTFSVIFPVRRYEIHNNRIHTGMVSCYYVLKTKGILSPKSGPFWSFLTFFGPF
jgi:hypothetical protein